MIRAGVIGWPIRHSLSPVLHGWWLKHYRLEGEYRAYAVEPEQLASFIHSGDGAHLAGFNVTVPHKQAIIPFLHTLTPVARRMGAVNTVIRQSDGTLLGDNTDGYGFITALKTELPTWRRDLPVLVLGAGGAARAVVDSLYGEGVSDLVLVNRTREHAARLAQDLRVPARLASWEQAGALLPEAGLIVNTTVLGMTGQAELSLDLTSLSAQAVVYDLVYNPLETELVKQARLRHHHAACGLGMLLNQAVPGFAAWFGVQPVVMQEQRAVLEEALA